MKKILIAVTVFALAALCLTFTASGAEASFKVDISGATAVTAGDTVKYVVEVKDINVPSSDPDSYDSGLASATIYVNYDTGFFDPSSVVVTDPEITNGTWHTSSVNSNGQITIIVMSDENSEGKNPTVNANGILVFEISLKVKTDAAEGAGKEIYVAEGTEGGDANLEYVTNVICSSLDVSLIKKLDAPSNAVLGDDKLAKWDEVDNADSYEVQVYKDGEALGKPLAATGTSFDLSTLIVNNYGGSYSFTVIAKSGSDAYKDSSAATSTVYNYRGKLDAPSITLTVDKISGTVSYKITDKNPEDTVGTYIIKVYDKDGNAVGEDIASSKLTGSISGLELGVKYDVTVTASSASLSNTESGNLSSDESGKVSVTPDGIVGIKVTKNPKLSYTEGDTIDLSGIEITVDFAIAADVKIGKDKLDDYGITVNPKHGADAILSLNGKSVTVVCGDITAAEELVLEVKSGQCAHTTTAPEHEDATCGKDGYDRVVCTVCGVTIENTPIPATGEHDFSDWEWLSKPTVNVDGVRQRTCGVCGEIENQQITYAEYLEMQSSQTTLPDSTPDGTTVPDDTTPPETTERRKSNALGGVADLGKIFLIALILVILVIVVFIVGAIYMESRRNRRRRSRSRTNQARSGHSRSSHSGSSQSRSGSTRNNYRR